jgi:hypothetical protein
MSSIKDWLAQGEKDESFLISDIAKHGCSGGVPGLTYYNETAAFYDDHEDEVWQVIMKMRCGKSSVMQLTLLGSRMV